MRNLPLILWLTLTGLFALVGTYSYFYMQARLKELSGYRPPFLKYPTDLWDVFVRYRGLAFSGRASKWPSKTFAFSVAGIVISILYLLLVPKPFG